MPKTYRINEIFYSLQGEGRNTGRAAIFVRFSGCNLVCPFCDTDFAAYRELSAADIVNEALQLLYHIETNHDRMLCVLTGGEPTLQADEALIECLHRSHFEVAMESNGTHEPPTNIDWHTVSPKERVTVTQCNELKCLYDGHTPIPHWDIMADYYYLQPLRTGISRTDEAITAACVAYVKAHPQWRLSLQTHQLAHFQ